MIGRATERHTMQAVGEYLRSYIGDTVPPTPEPRAATSDAFSLHYLGDGTPAPEGVLGGWFEPRPGYPGESAREAAEVRRPTS
jgi:hypothetical protein